MGLIIVVALLVLFVLTGLPTRRRLERMVNARRGQPGPIKRLRERQRAAARARGRRNRRRRGHLRSV